MKKLVLACCLEGYLAGIAGAAVPTEIQDPEVLLKATLERVLEVMQNQEFTVEDKEVRINRIVTPVFDFDLMSYFALGKTQWGKMTALQRQRFTKLFIERLKDSYRDKLALYTDEKIVYKPSVRKGNKIQIPTELITKDKSISVIYKLYNNKKSQQGWRIYDIEVQGVSLIKTYRSQFVEVLSKGTIEDLLKKLEEPLSEEAPAQP